MYILKYIIDKSNKGSNELWNRKRAAEVKEVQKK